MPIKLLCYFTAHEHSIGRSSKPPAKRRAIPGSATGRLCAIMETHPGGWGSSRMKDLADVVAYALTQSPSSGGLSAAIANECARRSMEIPRKFEPPNEWKAGYQSFALKAKTPEEYRPFDQSCNLASKLFDPILKGQAGNKKWNPDTLAWK